MLPWIRLPLQYFNSRTQLGSPPNCIPNGTVVSWNELRRRGQDDDRIEHLSEKVTPIAFASASADDVRNAKIAAGLLADADERLQDESAEQFKAIKEAAKPSDLAEMLHLLLIEWQQLETQLIPRIGKGFPMECNPPWLHYARNGFEADQLEAEMSMKEHYLRTIVEALKPDIANMDGVDITPLQRFLHTMAVHPKLNFATNSTAANADWLSALNLSELLPPKLATKEKAAAEKLAAENAKKGVRGFAKGITDEIKSEGPKKIAGWIMGLIGTGVGIVGTLLWTHRKAIYEWFQSIGK